MRSVQRRSLKALVWVLRPGKGASRSSYSSVRRGAEAVASGDRQGRGGRGALAAATREALEETGLAGSLSDLGFVHEFTTHKGRLAEEHAFLLLTERRAQVRISTSTTGSSGWTRRPLGRRCPGRLIAIRWSWRSRSSARRRRDDVHVDVIVDGDVVES